MACGEKIQRGHSMYKEGKHSEALEFYTGALTMAKTKAQRIALHSNRAACYLKLHDFKKDVLNINYLKAAEECTAVLELNQKHTGALMLRAQTLVRLKDYHSALFDVSRLIELDPTSDVYHDLEARLRSQLSLAPIPESEEESVLAEVGEAHALEGIEEEKSVLKARANDSTETESMTYEGNNGVESATASSSSSSSRREHNAEPEFQDGFDPDSNVHVPVHPKGWEAIPKPKGYKSLDYSRWDQIEELSDEGTDDEDEDSHPQYRFRVK